MCVCVCVAYDVCVDISGQMEIKHKHEADLKQKSDEIEQAKGMCLRLEHCCACFVLLKLWDHEFVVSFIRCVWHVFHENCCV